MSAKGFTLGELLGAKTVPCRVRGCTRTWADLTGSKALPAAATPGNAASGETAGMCEPCAKKFAATRDEQRACDRPGCTGTWTWSRQEQLEGWVAKRPPPRRLCASCAEQLAGLQPKEVACTVPGCVRTGVLSPEAQLLATPPPSAAPAAADDSPSEAAAGTGPAHEDGRRGPSGVTLEGPFCGPCAEAAAHLRDRAIACGINGCRRKWVWPADEQLAVFANPKGGPARLDHPPRRMCEVCRTSFAGLADRQVRCRASGCKKTWTWTRADQLDAANADQPLPKPPSRLCDSCFGIWSHLKDVERPCRQAGCTKTWTDRRGAQLARILRGKTGDPFPQYCEEHSKLVDLLTDREVPCKTEGCGYTWTWTKNQQLAAGVQPRLPAPAATNGQPAHAHAAEAANDVAPPSEETSSDTAAESVDEVPPEAQATADAESTAPPSASSGGPQGGPVVVNGPARSGKSRRRRRRREPQPPARHCARCAKFLAEHKTIEIPCKQCTTPIFWPPESQLQTAIGNWAEPSLCGACKRDATEAARQAAREALRHPGEAAAVVAAGEPAAEPAPDAAPQVDDSGSAGEPDGAMVSTSPDAAPPAVTTEASSAT